ncbi:hypothetical protein NQ317_000483 [Molorchus minor]|uniref:GIY-YIG domain-containing protein n=1 Tax=Molorchus minor TaxID=1323400 RepID=A0ABQ9JK76_9CUCU|nr:hypothetical protein NQ317_000483 [Molorchus minor]
MDDLLGSYFIEQNLSRILTTDDITIAYKNENTIAQCYSRLKSKTSKLEKSNVVYQITCDSDICGGVYIGQTKRYLKDRIREHEYEIRTRHNENKMNHTALVEHVYQSTSIFVAHLYIDTNSNIDVLFGPTLIEAHPNDATCLA